VFTLVHERVEFDNMQGTHNIKMQVKFIMIDSLTVLEPTFISVKTYAIGEQLRTSLKNGYY